MNFGDFFLNQKLKSLSSLSYRKPTENEELEKPIFGDRYESGSGGDGLCGFSFDASSPNPGSPRILDHDLIQGTRTLNAETLFSLSLFFHPRQACGGAAYNSTSNCETLLYSLLSSLHGSWMFGNARGVGDLSVVEFF